MKKMIVIFLLTIPFLASAQAVRQGDEALRVRGVYIAKETPEQIDFAISVRHASPDFRTCSDGMILITREISDLLVRKGLDRQLVRISGLSVNENFSYRHGERIREGFIGTAAIEVQAVMSKELTGILFSAIHAIEHDIEYSVRFSLSEQQKERLEKTSLEKAMEDAWQKARIVASYNNLELIRINRISLVEEGPGMYRQAEYDLTKEGMVFMDAAGSGFPELSINPKEISIYKSVEMEWMIGKKGQ